MSAQLSWELLFGDYKDPPKGKLEHLHSLVYFLYEFVLYIYQRQMRQSIKVTKEEKYKIEMAQPNPKRTSLSCSLFGDDSDNHHHQPSSQLFDAPPQHWDKKIRTARMNKQQQQQRLNDDNDSLDEEEDASCLSSTTNTVESSSGFATHRQTLLSVRHAQAHHPLVKQLTIAYDPKAPDMKEQIHSILRTYGLVVIKQFVPSSGTTTIRDTMLQDSEERRETICSALERRGLTYNAAVNDQSTIRFQQVAVRCKGRMDVRRPHTDLSSHHPLSDTGLDTIMEHVLYGGPDNSPKLVYSGYIYSWPESTDQPWHQDGAPLFPIHVDVPCYAVNVFFNLSTPSLESGPTEFRVYSHAMDPRHVSQQDDAMPIVSPVLEAGDLLLYDYRLCHRGVSNITDTTVRKVLYLLYARPWFREHLNFGTESLLS